MMDMYVPCNADPHIDAADAGARAATLLLKLLDGTVGRTSTVRVAVPLLCRGNEMITEPHAAGAVRLDMSAEDAICTIIF